MSEEAAAEAARTAEKVAKQAADTARKASETAKKAAQTTGRGYGKRELSRKLERPKMQLDKWLRWLSRK